LKNDESCRQRARETIENHLVGAAVLGPPELASKDDKSERVLSVAAAMAICIDTHHKRAE